MDACHNNPQDFERWKQEKLTKGNEIKKMKVRLKMGIRGGAKSGVIITVIKMDRPDDILQIEIDPEDFGKLLSMSGQPLGKIRYIDPEAFK